MSDPFEHDLEAMFAKTPVFDDADSFAARLVRRLEADDRKRRWALGLAGAVGAVIAAGQALSLGMQSFYSGAARTVSTGADAVAGQVETGLSNAPLLETLNGLAANLGGGWVLAGVLALLAVGGARLMQET